MYDYGKDKNLVKYGQEKPPSIDLTQIKDVPIAMFVGKQDDLGTPALGRWTKERVKDVLIHYEELDNHNHFSSSVGKDMSFMTTVIELLDYVNAPVAKAEGEKQVEPKTFWQNYAPSFLQGKW